MITINKESLRGSPDDIRAKLEELAHGLDDREYLAGTWLRELAVELACHDGLLVSVAVYEDASQDFEVTLADVPYCDPILIDRSDPGRHCQVTLERWLPISDQPGIKSAVSLVHSILSASARPDRPATGDTAAEA
jgi:hypothetical protein